MFRPKQMKKTRIITLKSVVEPLIKDLHEAGLIDIRKSRYEQLEEGRPLQSFDEISTQLLKLRTLIGLMETHAGKAGEAKTVLITGEEALHKAKNLEIEAELRALAKEFAATNEEMRDLENRAAVLGKIQHFKQVDFSKLTTKRITYTIGAVSPAKIAKLEAELEKADGESTLAKDPSSETTLILYEKEDEQAVQGVLSESGFAEFDIPEGTTIPAASLKAAKEELKKKREKLKEIKNEIVLIARNNLEQVLILRDALEREAERASISNKFSQSKHSYIIEGWIVAENYPKLQKVMERYASDAMVVDVPFGHDELPPTVLDNPKIASPFEFLTNSYSLPNYFELDPSMMYLIFLPIIYAMIVGDVVYGIISIGLGLVLMKKFENSYIMYNVSKIWFYSGFVTILFGMVFDEWGGMSHVMLLNSIGQWFGVTVLAEPLYEGFHRMAHILELVIITALVGMVHLAFGFALGAINEWNHNKKHAFAKIAWIGVELALLLTLAGAVGVVGSEFMTAGLVLLVISVIILAITEGILGIIELPGLLGNILSYTRIAAIGIVGIVIAELLNEFIMPMPEKGIILSLLLLPIFLVLHVVNAFIAMFESLVQGGRLNIVEFRSKFLHGGGEVFSPFKMR